MRRIRWVVAAAVVGFGLAGCSEGTQANESLPSASTSAAGTSAALEPLGPPDLPMPAEAREETADGATAFIAYYIVLMNDARAKLEPIYVRSLSSDCETCTTLIEGLQGYADSDYRVEGGLITLNGSAKPLVDERGAEFAIALSQQSSSIYEANGTLIRSTTDANFPASGALAVWDDERSTWLMRELTIQ